MEIYKGIRSDVMQRTGRPSWTRGLDSLRGIQYLPAPQFDHSEQIATELYRAFETSEVFDQKVKEMRQQEGIPEK